MAAPGAGAAVVPAGEGMITGLVAAKRGPATSNSPLIRSIPVTAVIEVTKTPRTSLVRVVVRAVRVRSASVRVKIQAQNRCLLFEDTMTIGSSTRITSAMGRN